MLYTLHKCFAKNQFRVRTISIFIHRQSHFFGSQYYVNIEIQEFSDLARFMFTNFMVKFEKCKYESICIKIVF